jgi:hypothetical protein
VRRKSGNVISLFEKRPNGDDKHTKVLSFEEYRRAQLTKAPRYLQKHGVKARVRIHGHELALELSGEGSLWSEFPVDLFRAVTGIVRGVQRYEGLVYDGEWPDRARSPSRKDIVYAWAGSKGILRSPEEARSTILLCTSVPGCEIVTIPVLVEEGPRGA